MQEQEEISKLPQRNILANKRCAARAIAAQISAQSGEFQRQLRPNCMLMND
jgi:hypothetical protein